MLLQSYFPFKFLAFTICFHKNVCIQWRSNCWRWEIIFSRRWIPKGIALFQKIVAFNKFSWEQKRRVNKLFDGKGIRKVSSTRVLPFVSVCVFVFLTSTFLFFRGLSIFSSVRYFFVEAYPLKKFCQMEIFAIVYPWKACLLNK